MKPEKMPEPKAEEITVEERLAGSELHPRHESYAQLKVRNSWIGLLIFLALAGLFIFGIELFY